MAIEEVAKEPNCTITWIIENVSYCRQRKGEMIKSPLFVADTLENTKWTLMFYPRGERNGKYIGYFLQREDDGNGVQTIEIDYELAFLAADGSVLNPSSRNKQTFQKRQGWGLGKFARREDVFAVKRSVYLPQDSACCRIWKSDEKTIKTRQFFARTIIQVEHRSFAWDVENFSSLEPSEKNTFVIKSASGVVLMRFDLHLTDGLRFEEWVNIDIECSDEKIKCLKFQTSLVDSKGNQVDCGQKEFLFDTLGKGDLTLLLTKKQLTERKTLYLPNDLLTLNCEVSFSTGVAFEGFERIIIGNIPSPTKNGSLKSANEQAEERRTYTLLDGFEFLYKNELLCDTKLCTKTETFPVHSVLLSARSPVFRAMFTTDMKEKAKESVNIPDADADTLRQLLQYVYTATLDIRDWENASLLYAAADKYEIMSLRNLCTSYFKNNFCPTNACHILVLSDMHRDEDLKKAVQDFIMKQGVIIFESNEWLRFTEANLKLAAETMHLNCIKH